MYRFHRSGTVWEAPSALLPNDTTSGQGFGSALSVSVARILIAAVADGALTGAAYVFTSGQ